ncbi:hypothetical protein [Nonomuraea cypriaca]|nr:hypothetical protein [Nonomuraea cypriaca]
MPVDFLSDSEAAKYGRYDGPPTRAEMEKIFFLDIAAGTSVAASPFSS